MHAETFHVPLTSSTTGTTGTTGARTDAPATPPVLPPPHRHRRRLPAPARPDYCAPLEIARVSTENPGLLPPEVHAHALHIAGLEHARAGRHREALACYRRALYVYDEKEDIDWQRLTHLLGCMAWTLDQLGDSRAQDMRTRYHLSRMTLEEKQKRRKEPPS